VQQSSSSFSEEFSLKQELDKLLLQEELLWKSKSREIWLSCKDLNTRFFHLSTLIRRRRNAIDFLKLSSGAWISDRASIGNCFTHHFSSLFSTASPIIADEMLDLFQPSISTEENSFICSIPTEQEIFNALTSIGSSKAPGPDGFTALFYKEYWHIVKEVVLKSVWDFFASNHLLKEQNHTFIALIPKQLGPFSVNHFRPISLCNIIYKIIAKILANRLKGLLHHFISPYQSAFVPSRSIQDNSILAHELLHTLKNKKGEVVLWLSRLIWKKPLTEWNGIFFLQS
jgi:hypothetical protein